MTAEGEAFDRITDRLRAEAAAGRFADLRLAVDQHADLIAFALMRGGRPYAAFQQVRDEFHAALAVQEDWDALVNLARTNADLLAVAFVQLAERRSN